MYKGWLAAWAVATSAMLVLGSVEAPASATAPASNRTDSQTTQVLTVTFSGSSAVLTDAARLRLNADLESMQRAATVTVTGFARGKKQSKTLVALSRKRAIAVRDLLMSSGLVAKTVLQAKGVPIRSGTAKAADRVEISYRSGGGLLWSQDFVEAAWSAPNPRYFSALSGDGSIELGLPNYGTGELEHNSPSAAYIDGTGNLKIRTSVNNSRWTSARIWTARKIGFKYGQLDIRAKFPEGSFNWPAIWMLGGNYSPPNRIFGTTQWPASGELDIVESLRFNTEVRGTLHGLNPETGGSWRGGGGVSALAPLTDITGDFHTWSIQWQPNQITFLMDGVWYAKNTFDGAKVTQVLPSGQRDVFDSKGNWPFNQSFFLILNNAVPVRAFAPEGSSSEFLIDYIHYSKFNGHGELVSY